MASTSTPTPTECVSEPRLLGAVLAGGSSRRFGRDKTSQVIGGQTLVARAATTLSTTLDEVVVVGGVSGARAEPWRRVPDLRRGLGPLGGLEAALTLAESTGWDGVFLLACDLPLVGPEIVQSVIGGLGTAQAAAPTRSTTPGSEPLCAAYRSSCLPVASELLDQGHRAVHQLVAAVETVFVDLDPEAFLNLNTPEDHRRARAILEEGRT